jgi:hypothetical protein
MEVMREGLAAMRGATAAIRPALVWFYDLLEGDRAGRQTTNLGHEFESLRARQRFQLLMKCAPFQTKIRTVKS